MATSIFSRKRDLVYLIFFVIHIPIVLFVDMYPLYPSSIRPQFMTDIRTFYIETYRDQFFTGPPAWFGMYAWMEALYHLPLSFWAVGALMRNDRRVPIQLLIYAVQTAVTTATCIADYMSWTVISNAEKFELGKLYVPYLALSAFMGVDMWARLDAAVAGREASSGKKRL